MAEMRVGDRVEVLVGPFTGLHGTVRAVKWRSIEVEVDDMPGLASMRKNDVRPQ